jgi:hypothetical protein
MRWYSGGTAGTKLGTSRATASMIRPISGLGSSTSLAARATPSSTLTVTP